MQVVLRNGGADYDSAMAKHSEHAAFGVVVYLSLDHALHASGGGVECLDLRDRDFRIRVVDDICAANVGRSDQYAARAVAGRVSVRAAIRIGKRDRDQHRGSGCPACGVRLLGVLQRRGIQDQTVKGAPRSVADDFAHLVD